MGNTVPPRMCRKEAGTAAAKARRTRPKNAVGTEVAAPGAAPRRVPVTSRKEREEDVTTHTRVGVGRRRAGGVSWAGGVGADDAVGKASTAATAVTVKIVLKRKDAEALVARLNAQSARERKARLAELKGEFRAGGDDCVGPAPCRDAWTPRLAPIEEN